MDAKLIQENLQKQKIGEHIPCGYSMSTTGTCDHIEQKHSLYLRRDCMKNFCESLGEHAKSIKQNVILTRKELKPFINSDVTFAE